MCWATIRNRLLGPKLRRTGEISSTPSGGVSCAMDPEEFAWLGAMEDYFGQEKAFQLLSALSRQEIQWRKGHALLGELMAAGELPLALVYSATVESLKAKGAPVDWVRTTKPLVASLTGVGIAKSAHPEGARLLVDFFLSTDGQRLLLAQGSTPVRADILPHDSPLNPATLTISPVSYSIIENLKHYATRFRRKTFGPRHWLR